MALECELESEFESASWLESESGFELQSVSASVFESAS